MQTVDVIHEPLLTSIIPNHLSPTASGAVLLSCRCGWIYLSDSPLSKGKVHLWISMNLALEAYKSSHLKI